MYQQVIEAIAVFASHGNSGGSAPWEINLVQKLCDWDIISPLRFTDDEWSQISSDGTCQNRRKSNVFKEPNGSIHYNEAFIKRPISRYNFEIEKPIGDLANKINFDLLNTFFNHQHEMTRSSSVNKTTMKNILNDGRDISIAKLVENTSLIIK